MVDRILYTSLSFVNHLSSKISVWSWQKLWCNRENGIGYKRKTK